MGIIKIMYLFDSLLAEWSENNDTLYRYIRTNNEILVIDNRLGELEMHNWIHLFVSPS